MRLPSVRILISSLALALSATVIWTGTAEAVPGKAPVAIDDQFSLQPGEDLVVTAPGVLDNDYDVDSGTITIGTVSDPTSGFLTMKTNGGFVYQPQAGFSGDATFTYKAIDTTGLQSAVATVTITIAAPNQAPVGTPDSYSTTSDTPLVVPVGSGLLVNDTDPDGDSLSVDDFDTPGHGTVSVVGLWDGNFTYAPAPGFVGTDTFLYRASDPEGAHTGWVVVTVTVLAKVVPVVPIDEVLTTSAPVSLDLGAVRPSSGGATVPVTAHVTNGDGPGAGVALVLSLGKSRFTATTGPSGDAVIQVRLPKRAGRYVLTGRAGEALARRPLTVGTPVTGKVTLPRTLHRGERLVAHGRIGTTRARLAVTLIGPGATKHTYLRTTSATGRLSVRLPAGATGRAGRYQVRVSYVADARHFAAKPWTRTFRSVR